MKRFWEKVQRQFHAELDRLIVDAVKLTMERRMSTLVNDVVAQEIRGSERYARIEAECREQLRRWPALKNDEQMMLAVSKTILRSFQS